MKKALTNYQYIPSIGILLFYCLYFVASFFYPGGSKIDLNASGFDWMLNYTCDLFHTHGLNGVPNPARKLGLIAIAIICSSLAFFFYQFAQVVPMSLFWKRVIPISGGFCMICAALVFTELHHIMVLLASFLGLITLIGIISAFLKNKQYQHISLGGTAIFLIVLNNYFYQFDILLTILPLIQKITIVLILSWVIRLNFELVNQQ